MQYIVKKMSNTPRKSEENKLKNKGRRREKRRKKNIRHPKILGS